MTQLSKFINLLIQFGEKLEHNVHKKYKPFISSIINLKELAKNVNPQKVHLTNEMIVFKIGIESKNTKCVQTSLSYLLKLFTLNFIDLNEPNYCENYIIMDGKVEHKPTQHYEREMRHEFVRWLEPLIHFKSNQINNLLLKIYEFLIGQPIIVSILEICASNASQNSYNILYSYFSYRFYLFEDCYLYREKQIQSFSKILLTEKQGQQVKNAMDRQEHFINLMEKYVDEIVVRAAGEGGKYGFCIICSQPADHYCKITKASLCGFDCKKKHLEIAEKQYKDYYHSILLGKSINEGIQLILKYLSQYNSSLVLAVVAQIFEKPQLFMLVCSDFKAIVRRYIPKIIDKVYQSRNEQIFETTYFLMASIIKWWPTECLSAIDYFLRESILQVLSDKKANFRILMLAFKSLSKMFQNGKTVIQIYANFDCEINQNNFIEKILFQLSKMAQDKYASSTHYHKQQKIAIKNSCTTIFQLLSKGLNEYRKTYPLEVDVEPVKQQKVRKANLQKFLYKFNEHWQEGLKSLFNLNLVGLDSDNEIINIIKTLEGLKKEVIDMMLFDKKSEQFFKIFMIKIDESSSELVTKMLQFYQYIPLTLTTSIGMKKFIQFFQGKGQMKNLSQIVPKIITIFAKCKSYQEFKEAISPFCSKNFDFDSQYLMMLNARKLQTVRPHKHYFRICQSKSYLDVISSQISLLQIPLSYMLDAGYDIEKIINLVKQLLPICVHSNWLSLLIKYSGIQEFNTNLFTETNLKTMKGVIEVTMENAEHILDWLTLLNFICNIHYILTQTPTNSKKVFHENKIILGQHISVVLLQKCLVGGSTTTKSNFKRYILAVLQIAKEELQAERIFMLQRFFQILDNNIEKYLQNFDQIYEEQCKFCLDLKPTTPAETMIYICDMVKQFFLRLLKQSSLKDEIALKYFQLLEIMLEKGKEGRQKDVTEFAMTCMGMVVIHHYDFKPKTWNKILQIFEKNGSQFRYQSSLVIKKILNEKVKYLFEDMLTVIKICFKQVSAKEQKSSNEALWSIKALLDFEINPLHQAEEEVEEKNIQNSKEILKYSIREMVDFISFDSHETVIEIIFLLFDAKTTDRKFNILTIQEINEFISKIFDKLEELPEEHLERGEKIMNQSLYWSVNKKNKNIGIIKILEKAIIKKYTPLSNTAIKCIKTYIQMANPREEEDWRQLQETLLNIINSCQINLRASQFQQVQVQKILENKIQFNEHPAIEVSQFIHQCKMQTMAVELLPNDAKCLDELVQVYKKKIEFNDNLLLRVAIWKKGLGQSDQPPDLLNLEEIFSNRIMAIYMRTNNHQSTLDFITLIYRRYLETNKKQEEYDKFQEKATNDCDDSHYEFFTICQNYWEIRKTPLFKIMAFALPKVCKLCSNKQQRKKMMLTITSVLPYIERRQPYVRAIKQLGALKLDD